MLFLNSQHFSLVFRASAIFLFIYLFFAHFHFFEPPLQLSVTAFKSLQRPRGSSCPRGSNCNKWLSWQSSASSADFLHKSGHTHHSLWQVNKQSWEGIAERYDGGWGCGGVVLVNSVLFHSLSTERLSWCSDWRGLLFLAGWIFMHAVGAVSSSSLVGETSGAGWKADN